MGSNRADESSPLASDTEQRCPSREELRAFSRGRLETDRLEAVGEHLAACPRCESTLSQFGDDSDVLLRTLRQAAPAAPYVGEPACRRLEARARAFAAAPPPAPPERALEGAALGRLGPYQLVRVVRAGGMGVVYEAWHTKLRRRVALKTVRSERALDPHVQARFQREMAAVGRLDHPNLVRATDADEVAGCHFLVMDYVDGMDLAEAVRRVGPLHLADACEVARQAAVALQYVHENGLVHRDVKASNLMVTAQGEVKLLDLGLALLYEASGAGDELSAEGQRLGTADYMAPEQARDSHGVDIRADLYSLGCTLYKLLAGRTPFSGPGQQTWAQKIAAHALARPTPVRELRPEVPAELQGVIKRLLAKAPADRFALPREVARALEPYTAGADLAALCRAARAEDGSAEDGANPHGPVATVSDRLGPRPDEPAAASLLANQGGGRNWPRGRLVAWAAGLLVAAVGLGMLLLSGRQGEAPSQSGSRRVPSPNAGVNWPQDYPEVLRDRPWGQRIELVRQAEPRPGRPPDPARDVVFHALPPGGGGPALPTALVPQAGGNREVRRKPQFPLADRCIPATGHRIHRPGPGRRPGPTVVQV